LIDRVHRHLSDAELLRISQTYHAWRGEKEAGSYGNVPGFCKSSETDDIVAHDYILTPGRYVGTGEEESDDEPFERKIARLRAKLEEQFADSRELETIIRGNLKEFEHGR